ncbi:hypothetical protein B0H10DRAFT_2216020 [Mycena sp. CBHHK59/15]|nr:hypothetical protein B0H10DRAFT_2216020 [Mycena sp. CBHHK59/15]
MPNACPLRLEVLYRTSYPFPLPAPPRQRVAWAARLPLSLSAGLESPSLEGQLPPPYYVLRDDLLAFYVGDVEQRLAAGPLPHVFGPSFRPAPSSPPSLPCLPSPAASPPSPPLLPPLPSLPLTDVRSPQEIEATLHRILSIHEALDLEHAVSSPHLARLFAPALPARLPDASAGASPGMQHVRRTAHGARCRTYASWPTYTVLPALDRVPDSEKGTVLQSIARVIQALPPAEEGADRGDGEPGSRRRRGRCLPEDARVACISRLEILAGVAKGLARTTGPLLSLDYAADGAGAELAREARAHPRTVALFEAIQRVADLWSEAAEVAEVAEVRPSPSSLMLVTIVVTYAQRADHEPAGGHDGPDAARGAAACARVPRGAAVWLTLATILVAQLNPPSFLLTLKTGPTPDAAAALAEIAHATLAAPGAPGGMTENPDIAQEFFACMDRVAQDFACMDRVAQDFARAFYTLPAGTRDALMQCTVSARALLARRRLHFPWMSPLRAFHGYADHGAQGCLSHRTSLYEELAAQRQLHGRVCGFAGAPRTTGPDLIALLTRFPNECRVWIPEILCAVRRGFLFGCWVEVDKKDEGGSASVHAGRVGVRELKLRIFVCNVITVYY